MPRVRPSYRASLARSCIHVRLVFDVFRWAARFKRGAGVPDKPHRRSTVVMNSTYCGHPDGTTTVIEDRVNLCVHRAFLLTYKERAPLVRDRQWNDLICEASATPAHGRRPTLPLNTALYRVFLSGAP